MKPEANGKVLLRGHGITRRWGGLVAVGKVSIELERGSVHAVIGTNGAGKSTLINILSGEIPPSGGRVELLGEDVTRWTQPRRARAGTSPPAWPLSQPDHTGHQLPLISLAVSNHSSALAVALSLIQWLRLFLLAGLITPAMWPEAPSTKVDAAPSSARLW